MKRSIPCAFLLNVLLCVSPAPAFAQISGDESLLPPVVPPNSQAAKSPIKVEPAAHDADIAGRLKRILDSTGWFEHSQVIVREGVVTLNGTAKTQENRGWAGDLAAKTEGVVAVINRIQTETDVVSTFGSARDELVGLGRKAGEAWPLVALAMIIISLAWIISRLVGFLARRFFASRVESPLLLAVVVRLFAIPVFLLGVYFVLQVAGLTRLALTVLGGTGIAGIVIGFAFRDIAENFLASLLLSVRNPFRKGDLIEVAGHRGIVQNLNTRSTVLLTLDGNHVQIPNSTVYKSTITNFSTNERRRTDFVIGIGYESSTAKAQALVLGVLSNHPAVLLQPEPLVLVDELGPASVNLKASYWFDSSTYAPNKINSALLRISKDALLEAGIELPDPAREVVFPRGVPIVRAPRNIEAVPSQRRQLKKREKPQEVTASEGRLTNECPDADNVEEIPEGVENLLKH